MSRAGMSRMAMVGWVLIIIWCGVVVSRFVRAGPEGVGIILLLLIMSLMGLLMGFLIVRLVRALRGSDLRWGWTLVIILVSAAAVDVVIEGYWTLDNPIIWAAYLKENIGPAAGITMVYHGMRRPSEA